jgi:hypothetical protein
MVSIDRVKASIVQLDDLWTLFQANPMQARRFETIHSVIEVCATLIPLMSGFAAKPPVTGALYDSDTVRRFYNESVGFILGEGRPIRLELWAGIINDIYDTPKEGLVGNKGSITGQQFARFKGDNRVTAPSFGQGHVRKELLSYAHRDILHMWLLRKNGIDDMLQTLTALSKIYAVMDHRPSL